MRLARPLAFDRRAVTAIEYALIGAFIFVVVIGAAGRIGTALLAPLGFVVGRLG